MVAKKTMTWAEFRSLREQLGLSQGALARHMGIAQGRLSLLEARGEEPVHAGIYAAFIRYIEAHPPADAKGKTIPTRARGRGGKAPKKTTEEVNDGD